MSSCGRALRESECDYGVSLVNVMPRRRVASVFSPEWSEHLKNGQILTGRHTEEGRVAKLAVDAYLEVLPGRHHMGVGNDDALVGVEHPAGSAHLRLVPLIGDSTNTVEGFADLTISSVLAGPPDEKAPVDGQDQAAADSDDGAPIAIADRNPTPARSASRTPEVPAALPARSNCGRRRAGDGGGGSKGASGAGGGASVGPFVSGLAARTVRPASSSPRSRTRSADPDLVTALKQARLPEPLAVDKGAVAGS